MCITLGVRLSLVSSKVFLYDSFVFVTNIEFTNSAHEVLLTPPTRLELTKLLNKDLKFIKAISREFLK